MSNQFLICSFVTGLACVFSSAILCYNNRSDWYWFLLAGVMIHFSTMSLHISSELIPLLQPFVNHKMQAEVEVK